MVQLVIHLEPTSPVGGLVWWAESPDAPGFSATDDELQGLIVRSRIAIEDAYPELRPLEFSYVLAEEETPSGDVVPRFEGEAAGREGDNPTSRSATARLVTAGG